MARLPDAVGSDQDSIRIGRIDRKGSGELNRIGGRRRVDVAVAAQCAAALGPIDTQVELLVEVDRSVVLIDEGEAAVAVVRMLPGQGADGGLVGAVVLRSSGNQL